MTSSVIIPLFYSTSRSESETSARFSAKTTVNGILQNTKNFYGFPHLQWTTAIKLQCKCITIRTGNRISLEKNPAFIFAADLILPLKSLF
ncbi:hypothetical protein CRE_16770 [Caenorhabditis remanei]|uniref:Uncharacterized protein n=1 Tax=Caenorhabditis remanei TaxID=31234 RepID=E3MAX8_CAERE|nr:hypothetical protein CRE_16770 [Caenorhabditis remanei]